MGKEKKKTKAPSATGKKRLRYPLNSLYFYLTEGCNLACRHCWIAPRYQSAGQVYQSLDLRLFSSIIEQGLGLGLTSVKLTGGEPLLHPHIGEIIELVKARELNLTVETNGLLCTAELAQSIASCRGAFVSVSIDGARAETHEYIRGAEGSFEKAVAAVRYLSSAGLRPQVIMSVMQCNREEIEGLVRLAEKSGAGSVKFNIVQPTARGEAMMKHGETLSISELVSLGHWIETELSRRSSLRLFYHHPAAFRPLGKMYGETGDGCGVCGILGILGVLSDGSYALCGIGETIPELVFGHAASSTLKRVWTRTPVLRELRRGLPQKFEGICGECVMKGACLGSCIAQNYYRNRSLWAPYWYCEEAFNASLFPPTRHISGLTATR